MKNMYIKIIESTVILPASPSNSLTLYFSGNCNFISKRAGRLFTLNDQRSTIIRNKPECATLPSKAALVRVSLLDIDDYVHDGSQAVLDDLL